MKDSDVARNTDPEYTADQIVNGHTLSVILDDTFLLVYHYGSPWYSTKVILEELMVLRIGKGGNFSDVCDLLDDLADSCGASDIIVGGALAKHPRALVRLYESRGYTLLSIPSLIKRR